MIPNETRFKILVKTIHGAALTYSVDKYAIEGNTHIVFQDRLSGLILRYPLQNAEIREAVR